MKRVMFALLLASGLFADFNSLAEEKAFQEEQKQKKEAYKQEYKKKFDEIVIPRINNLKAFNDRFYEKYLVKESDTQEMIDEKFKNRAKLYSAMRKDLQASQAEYKIIEKARSKICDAVNVYCDLKIAGIDRIPKEYSSVLLLSNSSFMSTEPIYGEEVEDRQRALNKDRYESYEDYLRKAYDSYTERQERAKRNEQSEAENAKKLQEYEANKKAIAAERKRVEPACQKWRANARKRVNSVGVGDRIISSNGGVYIVSGINANTFAVISPLTGGYIYLQKNTCIPQGSLQNAPSPYCYK